MNDKFSLLKRMRRLSGILVHPTSLPGKFGIGDLGPEAYRFVDFLQESGQHLWQTLPLGPTGGHNSPYQCFSSFAGQPLLISPELLKDEGLLTDADLSNVPHFSDEEVDFAAVGEYKEELFKKAFARFKELPEDNPLKSELALFCKSAHWLDDYAMFMAIKKSKGGAHWLEWEKKYRKPTKSQKAVIEREFEDEILYEKFLQWTFCRQWSQLKAYANERDILLIGDIPIFVSGDSADVWAEPRLFQVDSDGFPTVVAGVPPDYFSATGQLWGNPLYDWKYHKKTNYEWWMERFKTQFLLSDIVRIDHFRGLESYWEIPADSETALNGKWVDGPKDEFFEVLIKTFGEEPPIIAEDLGIITDYAMFMAIKKSKGGAHWLEWEKKYRKPTKSQKAVIEREFEDEILYEKFLQWTFCRQWSQLKAYANERDILLIGDIPIFVSGDSADVWAEPRLFQVDSDGFPTVVAGVPPDYFSATGQLWGNPLYDWKYHKKTNYEWWMERFKTQFLLSDIVRIDHFRGLESYWEIPADSETALNGKWVDGPKDEFFEVLIKTFGEEPPIIAEDLGIITDDVRALRDKFGLPGMKILQFAFEDEDSNYLPYNQPYNCVCYTGTHDNDTTTGWYATASEKARDKVRRYMNTDASQVSWDFIRTCFGSPARFAIIPVQDLFCQGSDCRMNTPGKADGNWAYRMKKELLTSDVAKRLYDVTKLYGRQSVFERGKL